MVSYVRYAREAGTDLHVAKLSKKNHFLQAHKITVEKKNSKTKDYTTNFSYFFLFRGGSFLVNVFIVQLMKKHSTR